VKPDVLVISPSAPPFLASQPRAYLGLNHCLRAIDVPAEGPRDLGTTFTGMDSRELITSTGMISRELILWISFSFHQIIKETLGLTTPRHVYAGGGKEAQA